ncbi:UDP-glycosyltransferase UGT40K1 [Operophtera brumata]|uniref:UDP-glycosyltransferase UGT40K1 n=1 Tax=Operophtera brumata TaxID=104452 RepID=A0A0L7L1Z9_OPEBR|nr:UDP-glycosyltransferase UGT40K1 [Operophtera brumata]
MEAHWHITKTVDEALSPAYNSDFLSASVAPFSFRQRVEELWTQIKVTAFREFVLSRTEATEYSRLIAPHIEARGRKAPAYEDLRYTASMVFANSHISFAPATSLPQRLTKNHGQCRAWSDLLQHGINAHTNCVLFISHGGLLSTTETIHFGVPVVGIPVFADQFVNVAKAVLKGFAKKVSMDPTIDAAELKEAIEEVLTDPK